MSTLDWNNPNHRDERYWRELYQLVIKRLNIVSKCDEYLVSYIEYFKNLLIKKDNFKIWPEKRTFEMIEDVLNSNYWVDPNLTYKLNEDPIYHLYVPYLGFNDMTSNLTVEVNSAMFPAKLRKVHNVYKGKSDKEKNKCLKFYHDELIKRRYTTTFLMNLKNYSNQTQMLGKYLHFHSEGRELSGLAATALGKAKKLLRDGGNQQESVIYEGGVPGWQPWTGSGTYKGPPDDPDDPSSPRPTIQMDGFDGHASMVQVWATPGHIITRVKVSNVILYGDTEGPEEFYGPGQVYRWEATPLLGSNETQLIIYAGGSVNDTTPDAGGSVPGPWSFNCEGEFRCTLDVEIPERQSGGISSGDDDEHWKDENELSGYYHLEIAPIAYTSNPPSEFAPYWNYERRTITKRDKAYDGTIYIDIEYRTCDLIYHTWNKDWENANVMNQTYIYDQYSPTYKESLSSAISGQVSFVQTPPSGYNFGEWRLQTNSTPISSDIHYLDFSAIDETMLSSEIFYNDKGAEILVSLYYDWSKSITTQ